MGDNCFELRQCCSQSMLITSLPLFTAALKCIPVPPLCLGLVDVILITYYDHVSWEKLDIDMQCKQRQNSIGLGISKLNILGLLPITEHHTPIVLLQLSVKPGSISIILLSKEDVIIILQDALTSSQHSVIHCVLISMNVVMDNRCLESS